MSPTSSRWLIVALFLFAVPWPMFGPLGAFVPAARYVLLAIAAAAVGLTEGAAGVLPMIIGLLVAQAIGTVLLAIVLGRLVARLLIPLSPRMRAFCVIVLGGGWLLYALTVDVYQTTFGDRDTATLLGVFFS
ncbi:MAG: hypothetical protein JRF61_25225 [Deltaproteobacteria bacterium]|jgi:hypothetical protein|nr:hypothetical protein [Deltaproteobacteria bacterium]